MQSSENDDEKLGHDPLEWLAEEETDESTGSEVQAQAEDVSEDQAKQAETNVQLEDVPQDEEVTNEEDNSAVAEDNSGGAFVLPEKLTVQHIEELHVALKQRLAKTGGDEVIAVDASELTDFDSSGYQLLVSLIKSCEQQQRTCEITNVSDSIQKLLTLVGDQTLTNKVVGG